MVGPRNREDSTNARRQNPESGCGAQADFLGDEAGVEQTQTQRKMGRNGIASTADHRRTARPDEVSAGAQVERFYVSATRQFLDSRDDLRAMMEELVADDGMRRQHDQLVALDSRRM